MVRLNKRSWIYDIRRKLRVTFLIRTPEDIACPVFWCFFKFPSILCLIYSGGVESELSFLNNLLDLIDNEQFINLLCVLA